MSQNVASYYIPPSAVQYNNYVSAQTVGPLNSAQTPNVSGIKNLGTLTGVHPNPPQFYPADHASEFANARHQYWRTASSVKQQQLAREKVVAASRSFRFFSPSTQNEFPVTGHMNYIVPPPSGLYTSILKSRAVGKSSLKQGLPPTVPLSYKNYNTNDVKTSLRRVRGGGCVAPPKCSAVYNTVCTKGSICNSGAIVGQGY
jgi:hypothetical protein